jgi:hypothetical protein
VAERLARKNVADLEKLATALFVTQARAGVTEPAARAEEIHKLKPHISPEQARAAVVFVDRMVSEAKEFTAP